MYSTYPSGNLQTKCFPKQIPEKKFGYTIYFYRSRIYKWTYAYEMIRNRYVCHYESFGDTWRKRRCKLLGHILRCHRDDPLFQVTFSCHIFSARTGLGLTGWLNLWKMHARPLLDQIVTSTLVSVNFFQIYSRLPLTELDLSKKYHKHDGDLCVPRPLASGGNAHKFPAYILLFFLEEWVPSWCIFGSYRPWF